MSHIGSLLVRADRFCDYVPVVSSIVNLFNLFQKCVVFPFQEKSVLLSSYYWKKIDKKSFVRCFLLLIPVVGNIIISIHDCTKKKVYKNIVIYPKKNGDSSKIDCVPISINDVEKIEVSIGCLESSPCQHQTTITLRDGRKAYPYTNEDIFSIVSAISEENVNPGSEWRANKVKEHFKPRTEKDWKTQGDQVNVVFFSADDQVS